MPRRAKWEIYTDEASGHFYFYNTLTGETTWELPSREAEDDGDAAHEQEATRTTASATRGGAEGDDDLDPTTAGSGQARVAPTASVYDIAAGVVEAMLGLVDAIEHRCAMEPSTRAKRKVFVSAAAEARHRKNAAKDEKRRKRERLLAMTRYMNLLIPPVTPSTTANDEGDEDPTQSATSPTRRPVGSLFTKEDAFRWRLEKEVEQIRKRYAIRRQRKRHHVQVYARMSHDHFLKQFRSDLLKFFLSRITCSTELQEQRILLLSSPQEAAELERRRKAEMEPEVLERYENELRERQVNRVRNTQKVYVLADDAGVGRLHLLQLMFSLFSNERARMYATKVRGLAEVINTVDIQRFIVEYVSKRRMDEGLVTIDDFQAFVEIIEDVVDHYTSVRAAVLEAEDEIAATLEGAFINGGSRLQARIGIMSKKKVQQELALLKATRDELEAKKNEDLRRAFISHGESLIESKEQWEKNHQHRYIQIGPLLPSYCCICRRRLWEQSRHAIEEEESAFRETWATRCALKMKAEELRIVEADQLSVDMNPVVQDDQNEDVGVGLNEVPDESAIAFQYQISLPSVDFMDDTTLVVLGVVNAMVTMIESFHSSKTDGAIPKPRVHLKPARQLQTGTRKRKKKVKKMDTRNGDSNHDEDNETDELKQVMLIFESEERERKAMYVEDSAMAVFLEKGRRLQERPHLQIQDGAHNAYIRLLSHCVNPSSLLYRLQFVRCLSSRGPQELVLIMSDGAVMEVDGSATSRLYILQTIPCRSDREAESILADMKKLKGKVKSPFLVQVVSCAKHTYHFFSESGVLVECWPVVFVVLEYLAEGSWATAFTRWIQNETTLTYPDVEKHLTKVFRKVAAALATLHSADILHLNVNIGNLFLTAPLEMCDIKLSGYLMFKFAFHSDHLCTGSIIQGLNNVITPPEATRGLQVTTKADVWMLGAAVYDALMVWQRTQLRRYKSQALEVADDGPEITQVILRTKGMSTLLQDLPLGTSPALRTLLRMLLQPNPAQRPDMNQVVDYLTFAESRPSAL